MTISKPAKTNAARRRAERAGPQFRVQLHHKGWGALAAAWCGVGPVFTSEQEARAAMKRHLSDDASRGFSYEYRVASI